MNNDAHDALIDFLARALDSLPIEFIAAIPADQAHAIHDAARALDGNFANEIHEAFLDNIIDY